MRYAFTPVERFVPKQTQTVFQITPEFSFISYDSTFSGCTLREMVATTHEEWRDRKGRLLGMNPLSSPKQGGICSFISGGALIRVLQAAHGRDPQRYENALYVAKSLVFRDLDSNQARESVLARLDPGWVEWFLDELQRLGVQELFSPGLLN